MSRLSLPTSVQVLQAIPLLLEGSETLLTPTHADFKQLKKEICAHESLDDMALITQSPMHIRYLQALMLAGLSMYGGILVPCLKQFSFNDDTVRLSWDTGMSDQFKKGVWNTNFSNFSTDYLKRLQISDKHSSKLPVTLLHGIQQRIKSYHIIIESVDFRMQELLKGKAHFLNLLKQPLHHDLLFILISSLPPEHMNQLFMFVQQYLPEDLTTKTPDGNIINVCAFFQQSNMDVAFLIEKSKVYLDLYYTSNKPVIKEITQHKTSEYLIKILQNSKAMQDTLTNIQTMKQAQIDLRLALYNMLLKHFDQLLT